MKDRGKRLTLGVEEVLLEQRVFKGTKTKRSYR